MRTKTEQLKLKDFRRAIICFVVGGVIMTGLLCLFLGLFYNRELQSISNAIDGIQN